MTESTEHNRPALVPLASGELESLLTCERCALKYQAGKSTSSLRLTYCSFLCELGDLGFSMAGLESMERDQEAPTEAEDESEAPPALAGAEG